MPKNLDAYAAIILICVCGILLGLGIDGEVKSVLVMAGAYLFGKGVQAKVSV